MEIWILNSPKVPQESVIWSCKLSGNPKYQITNIKWFDKLTTLSQVEGQFSMTKIRNFKPVLVIGY